MVHDRPELNEPRQTGQVLNFRLRPRASPPSARQAAPPAADADAEPVDDLAGYEEEDRNIDYRHRLLMNVIAVAIVSVLITAGVWIADTIVEMQKDQDCIPQGRQNCAPIEVPVKK